MIGSGQRLRIAAPGELKLHIAMTLGRNCLADFCPEFSSKKPSL
jgi:hypothetical protein